MKVQDFDGIWDAEKIASRLFREFNRSARELIADLILRLRALEIYAGPIMVVDPDGKVEILPKVSGKDGAGPW